MAIKVKIYEFDTVDELKQYEELSKEKVKVEFEVEKRVETEEPSEEKKGLFRNGKGWTRKEEHEFLEILKDSKSKGFNGTKALSVASKKLGRTFKAVGKKQYAMGIKYQGLDSEPQKIFITKMNGRWTKQEEDYIVSEVKPFCDAGKRIPKKIYRKLEKALKRKPQIIRYRILVLKNQGRLKKVLTKQERQARVKNMMEARGYMISRKAKIPEEKGFHGTVSEHRPLFSKLLNGSQEKALKDMIRNDLKTNGFCKVYREKTLFFADLNQEEYLQLLQDMMANSHKFQKELNATMKVKGIGQDKFLIFS